MEELQVNNASLDRKIKLVLTILDNMRNKQHDIGHAHIMLGGDVGIGKTSFIHDLVKILGLDLIIIETPHLVEEHIINIPFIVVKNGVEKKNELNAVMKDKDGHLIKDFDVQLANSNLFSQVSQVKKLPEAQYKKSIIDIEDNLQHIMNEVEKEEPGLIDSIRKNFEGILFLDEYYRQTSTHIRNMLREILNGRIGQHEIPDNLYVIFASNLTDEGVEPPLDNEEWQMPEFHAPETDDWFAYFIAKYKKEKHGVKLNDAVVKKFFEIFKIEANEMNISHDEMIDGEDIRISPRRWEQLILYISSSLPVKDENDAEHLLQNVKINFREYQSGATAKITKVILSSVQELIKETSGIDVSVTAKSDDWRTTLEHQIQQKIKLGGARKYIPVISGLPGTGKTSHINDLARDLLMVPVFINVMNLSAEDIIGLPLSKTGDNKEIDVKFSKPPLAIKIDNDIRKSESHLKQILEKFYSTAVVKDKLEEYKTKKFKYLIFFDEFNRPKNTKVFNAIRRVVLEKSFGGGYDLPEGSVIVAAINPTSSGTIKFTKHLRDVLDVIPVGISWPKFKKVLDEKVQSAGKLYDKEAVNIVNDVFSIFIDRFKDSASRVPDADSHFFLNVSGTTMYVSPREYTDLIINTLPKVNRAYIKAMKEIDTEEEVDLHKIESSVRLAIFEGFQDKLKSIEIKSGLQWTEFNSVLKTWFMGSDEINVGNIFKTQVKASNITTVLDKAFDKKDVNLFDDSEFLAYINSVEPTVFQEDLYNFLVEKLKHDFSESLKVSWPLKKLSINKAKVLVSFEKTEITKIEFIIREIVHALTAHNMPTLFFDRVKDVLLDMLEFFTTADNTLTDDDSVVTEIATKLRTFTNEIIKQRKGGK